MFRRIFRLDYICIVCIFGAETTPVFDSAPVDRDEMRRGRLLSPKKTGRASRRSCEPPREHRRGLRARCYLTSCHHRRYNCTAHRRRKWVIQYLSTGKCDSLPCMSRRRRESTTYPDRESRKEQGHAFCTRKAYEVVEPSVKGYCCSRNVGSAFAA